MPQPEAAAQQPVERGGRRRASSGGAAVEELPDPVRIEGPPSLLDAEFLQDLKVPLRPAGIRIGCGEPSPRLLVVIAHGLHTLLLAIANILVVSARNSETSASAVRIVVHEKSSGYHVE